MNTQEKITKLLQLGKTDNEIINLLPSLSSEIVQKEINKIKYLFHEDFELESRKHQEMITNKYF